MKEAYPPFTRPCRSSSNRLEPAAVIWVLSLAILVSCRLLIDGADEPPTRTLVRSTADPLSWATGKLLGVLLWLSYASVRSTFSLFFSLGAKGGALLRRGIYAPSRVSSLLTLDSGSSPATAVTQAAYIQENILGWLAGRSFDYAFFNEKDEKTGFPSVYRRIADFFMVMRLIGCIPGSRPFADKYLVLDKAEEALFSLVILFSDRLNSRDLFAPLGMLALRMGRVKIIERFVKHPLISVALNRIIGKYVI